MENEADRLFCVVTSIAGPTEAMYSWLDKHSVIVVADLKTPAASYEHSGFVFIPTAIDHGLSNLPWNHYSRKMIGYVEAYHRGARYILDTDDDTYFKDANPLLGHANFEQRSLSGPGGFVNIYALRYDGALPLWPRGLPLRYIRESAVHDRERRPVGEASVIQFLIDGDTDVDAIHRLVFGEQDIAFQANRSLDYIAPDNFCPFNSQLTLWRRDVFPLMYLPTTVSFRFTDILRSVVAKRVMDQHELGMAFSDSVGYQVRNPHDLTADLASEVPCYLETEAAWKCLEGLDGSSIHADLRESYRRLANAGICDASESASLNDWIACFEE